MSRANPRENPIIMQTDILIFNVGLGQSVFIYPHGHPEYAMMVDCGHSGDFHPIDFLSRRKYIVNNDLPNLTVTNYDQDHISSLPYLRDKFKIRSVNLAPNLTSAELRGLKALPHSDALNHVCHIKDTYTTPALNYTPPYRKVTFYLDKHHLEKHTTNDLSQIVFIEHMGSVICISGDLETTGWAAMLKHRVDVTAWLQRTHVFIASHHGRDNGYHPEIFQYCNPECIIISDKDIIHDTQEGMSTLYGKHVSAAGIVFNGNTTERRKVLTTRCDGHIWVRLDAVGNRTYKSFSHE